MGDLDGLGYRDTTAVLVGCSTGIGEATLRILGDLGARVHAVGRHQPAIACDAFHPTDLADLDSVATTAAALREIGPIDHVLTCAGVPPTRPRRETLLVNYIGLRHLIDSVVPAIADGGNICVSGSDTAYGWERQVPTLLELVAIDDPREALAWCDEHAKLSADGFPAYVFSKQALITWVTHRAPSLGETRRIRLNCAAPGLTETAMPAEIAAKSGSRALIDAYPNPLFGRITTPEEQAWPMLLLNSPRNTGVTGTVLFTDQGVAGGLMTGALTFGV
jgi:NAD(P)-dependent dehydrogenase (short-subunit alcohol dehydrogenase family)